MTPTGTIRIGPSDALIVVDPQNDFLPGGTLAVAQGRRIFEPINRLMPRFPLVVATRDWHPEHHAYFQAHGGPWPFHCLAGTPGAAFSPELHGERVHEIVSKGTDPQTDGYSGFAGTDLAARLRARSIARVFVCGLATDYCVKATALDALAHGFEAYVVLDAIAAVNARPGDEERALDELRANGVRTIHSSEIA